MIMMRGSAVRYWSCRFYYLRFVLLVLMCIFCSICCYWGRRSIKTRANFVPQPLNLFVRGSSVRVRQPFLNLPVRLRLSFVFAVFSRRGGAGSPLFTFRCVLLCRFHSLDSVHVVHHPRPLLGKESDAGIANSHGYYFSNYDYIYKTLFYCKPFSFFLFFF